MEFKSSEMVVLKSILNGLFGGAALAIIAYFFLPLWVAVALGVAVVAYFVYGALFGDRIRVTVYGDAVSVYRRGKLKHSFTLGQVSLRAKVSTSGVDSDCMLTVEDASGETVEIDCTLMGANRFYRLLDALHLTDPQPVEVETTQRQGK